MNNFRLVICQIPLSISTYPVRISNPIDHQSIVNRCIKYAIELKANLVVFPEYAYNPDNAQEYTSYSKMISIIAGSFQNEHGNNETVLFNDGNTVSFYKRNLSPYEETATPNLDKIVASELPIKSVSFGNINTLILPCMDFFLESRKLVDELLQDGGKPDLVIAPSCNNKPHSFLAEAESNHFHRAGLTTVICNVSKLSLNGGDFQDYGGSSVFGEYERHIRDEIVEYGWCDSSFQQMIGKCPPGDHIMEVDLHIPYMPVRKSTNDYAKNPENINVLEISKI